MSYEEGIQAKKGNKKAKYYQEHLNESSESRKVYKEKQGVITAEEMPWEDSPQGLLKHVVNEKMGTRECALDMYMQFLDPDGCSGKHRHLSEEVFFVLEGKGYDLHWDVDFSLKDEYEWTWAKEPKKFEWEEGDFVYIPPYSEHQHFNSDPNKPARLLCATSRIVKALGFDWIEQVEPAPKAKERG